MGLSMSLLTILVFPVGMLSSCRSEQGALSQPESPVEKDSVIIAMDTASEPEAGFDPVFGWGAGEHVHEPLIQSTLTVTNPDLTIGYDLATRYSVSEDGMTWTVTIREDARFTDGTPLTASDVAFTYNTVKNSSSVNDFTMLDYAEAIDGSTVVFHMSSPFSIWPYTMAVVGIVPEHAYDSASYGLQPIGSGRYLLKQWDRGQQVILEANPDYYGEPPKMKKVTILFMEEDAAFLAVQAGQVDLAYTSAYRPGRWIWPTPRRPIPMKLPAVTSFFPAAVWITGELTCLSQETLSPPIFLSAAPSISVLTGRK